MAKGYWIAFGDVADPEAYKAYIAENAAAFRKYGARFLVRNGASERPEGHLRQRPVVVEFPDYASAAACYHSPEYATALALRLKICQTDLIVVEGYDGPQPGD